MPARVCPACRTVIRGGACGVDERHTLLDLSRREDQRRFDSEVWDSDRERALAVMARRDQALRVVPMAAGLVVPAVLFPLIGTMPWGPGATLAATVALGGGTYAASHARGYRRLRGRPRGLPAPRVTLDSVAFTGRVEAKGQIFSPIGGHRCVAYYVEFSRDDTVVLREFQSIDVAIRVDDSEVVRLEDRPLPIVGEPVHRATSAELRAYLGELGLSSGRRRLALTHATERVLLDGDVVEIAGEFDDGVEHPEGGLYRGIPTRVQVPRRVDHLQIRERDPYALLYRGD